MVASRLPSVRAACAVALCAAAALVAGCGGDSGSDAPGSDADAASAQAADVKAVTALGDQVSRAIKQRDPRRICARLEPESLKREFRTKQRCVKALGKALENARGEVPPLEFKDVTVQGETAKANLRGEGQGDIDFVRIDGEWYIDLHPDEVDDSAEGSE